ncbi:hypothetical protein GS4_23_01320 [Gordonia soli NBRC 108243]|uniref:Uncharacterized protein n=1 Tax=Gordonia soli NBRC 108243 TaxID=1223545 RepID=M0QL17_9ACTN|nr:hypothetical protein GS4_23_01320 [Gordonia soli NBRC 108243]
MLIAGKGGNPGIGGIGGGGCGNGGRFIRSSTWLTGVSRIGPRGEFWSMSINDWSIGAGTSELVLSNGGLPDSDIGMRYVRSDHVRG